MHILAVQWVRTDLTRVWEHRLPLPSFILTIIIVRVRAHPHPPSLSHTPVPAPPLQGCAHSFIFITAEPPLHRNSQGCSERGFN